jgi:hypothetical protein
MELQLYRAVIDPSMTSELEVDFIGLVDRPAIEKNFQVFNENKEKARFILNEEKRIISGPAMVADMPIYRNDTQLGEYFVMFDKGAIQTIVEKFSAKGYLKNFNLFHDQQQQVSDVTIFNSFISSKELGIPPMVGFEDVGDGSWFISAKVNNDAVWEKVKAGEIKGFSVEGLFNYIPVNQMKMRVELTQLEVSFLQEMIPHHKMAVDMASEIPSDSAIYAFAQGIIKAQSLEIQQMQTWLNNQGVSVEMSAEQACRYFKRVIQAAESH